MSIGISSIEAFDGCCRFEAKRARNGGLAKIAQSKVVPGVEPATSKCGTGSYSAGANVDGRAAHDQLRETRGVAIVLSSASHKNMGKDEAGRYTLA
jgi:hypothetical protein